MTRETILEAFRERGCHAYQAEFAADFLREGSASHHLLVTPAGLGKVLVGSQIIKFMVEHGQARRVLVIAPSAFCMLWRSRLADCPSSVPVQLVHSRAFGELQASVAPDGSPWPKSIVAIVPCDTATRAVVRETLASVCWDMVIVAEVHSASRCRSLEVYQEMLAGGAIGRSMLIGAAPLEPRIDEGPSSCPEFEVTNWLTDVADWDGASIELPAVQWRVLEYRRTEHEVGFLKLLQEQLQQLSSTPSPFLFQSGLLVRRAASSPYAAERTLEIIGRKLSRAPLRELAAVSEKEHGDPTEVEDVPHLSFSPEARKSYLRFVQDAYGALLGIESDAKLACLLGLLRELADGRPGRICVLSAFADTVSYLHRALSDIGSSSVAITGGLRYAERQQAMKDFGEGGGILLATPGALGEESDLNGVKHVVHYDMPATRSQMAQLEGRFGRINRTHACRMYALEDLSGAVCGGLPIEQLLEEAQPVL